MNLLFGEVIAIVVALAVVIGIPTVLIWWVITQIIHQITRRLI